MPTQLTKIGKYDVLEVIGRGGMGVVYKATDPHIGRFVAIKMITAGFAGNPDLLKRFYREAQSTGNLQNPNIVTVYDLGDQDGNPYLVMEYLEGASLESIIAARKPLTIVEKLGIIIDVCNGLSYAHQRGVIHRDIKPANVMVLNDGVAKIVDFGIARIGNNRDTGTGQVIGSFHYMSPEQLRGQPLDFRTDIYSTGVLVFQLLTNELPFDASETGATLLKIIQETAPPLSTYLRDYPRELDRVVGRALAKNRDERYGSAKDLAFDLLRIQEEIKQSSVAEFLRRATGAIQRSEWGKAKDQLQQALRVDRQHTEAHRLLRDVQQKIDRQQKTEQARRLQMDADQAFIERKFDEALSLLEQALALDPGNEDLRAFRESVQATQHRAAKLEEALRRAEAAQIAGNLEEASQAVAEALALDSNDTQAKALKVILSRQIEERARTEEMRKLLDQARADISARRLTSAFDSLQRAESLEANSVELQRLMKMAVAAREQELRKADLEHFGEEIQEALSREDYKAAADKAAAGLEKYPRERELLKLQALAEGQRQRVEERRLLRETLAAANSLLDEEKLGEALAILEAASPAISDNTEISSLRGLISDRLRKAQAEARRGRILEEAREALASGDFATAVAILEKARAEFSRSAEIGDLLTAARAELVKQRAVAEARVFASQLIERRELERAAEFLEATLREMPEPDLRDLLRQVRTRQEEFQSTVQSAIERAQRMLREQGAQQAGTFLDAQPSAYLAVPDFREFRQAVRMRQLVEDLDRGLRETADLDQRVALAERVLRSNPGNQEVQDRLLAVRQKRELVQSIVQRANGFESVQEYDRAAETWNSLRNVYPEYPNLDPEVARLQKLQQQKQATLLQKAREAEVRAERARAWEAEKARQAEEKAQQAEAERLRQLEAQKAREAEVRAAAAREQEIRRLREAEAARKAREAENDRLREAEAKAAKAREADAKRAREAEEHARKVQEAEARRAHQAELKAAKARAAEEQKAREAELRLQRTREEEARKAREAEEKRQREAELQAQKVQAAEAKKAREAELRLQRTREEAERKAREAEDQKQRQAELQAQKVQAAEAKKAREAEFAAASRKKAQLDAPPESSVSVVAAALQRRGTRILAAAASIVLIVGVAIVLFLHETSAIPVHIATDPPGSRIAINGGTCVSPCTLQLKPGTYEVRADHDGYETVTQDITIDHGGSVPTLHLQPTATSRPPAPLAPELGTVSVQTNVDALVLLDGEPKGNTGAAHRLQLSVPEGRHEFRVEKPDWQSNPQSVSVIAKSTLNLSFRLERSSAAGPPSAPPAAAKAPAAPTSATLIVDTVPGAEIRVDQQAVGIVPPGGELSVPVAAGQHSLEARLDGYKPWSRSAMFKAGMPVEFSVDLTKIEAPSKPAAPIAPASASLTANPAAIQQGQSTTLLWQTRNATQVSIDQGLGSVAASGSKQITPSQTSTYTLTATGPGGTSTSSFSIVVQPKPAVPPPVPQSQVQAPESDHGLAGPTNIAGNGLDNVDQLAVRSLLAKFNSAFERGQTGEIKALWPSIDKRYTDAIHAGGGYSFAMALYPSGDIRIAGDRAMVPCRMVATTKKPDGQSQSTKSVEVTLRKNGNRWVVVDALMPGP